MTRHSMILLALLVTLAAPAAAVSGKGFVDGVPVNTILIPADGRVHEFDVIFESKEAGYTNELRIDQPLFQLVWTSCDPTAQPYSNTAPPGEIVFEMKNGQGGDFFSGTMWSQSSDGQPHFVIIMTNAMNPTSYFVYVEDLSGLGDQDYNDCVFRVNVW